MRHLSVNSFPVCCGAEVLGHFGYAKNNIGAQRRPPIAETEADLKEADEQNHVGLKVLTLASEQREHIEPSLKKFGYKLLVENFYHPGHRSRISLYGKVMHPTQEHKSGDIPYGETKAAPREAARTTAATQRTWGQAVSGSGARPVW